MAFCNNRSPCGRDCGRQDDHGGSCDCYETGCPTCNRREPEAPRAVAARCLMTVFAVRREGKFYRTNNTGARGRSGWVDKLEDAKLWTRAAPAKGKVTALSTGDDVPELVELVVTEFRVVKQSERVAAAQAKKARDNAERDELARQQEFARATAELLRAQERVNALSAKR